MLGRLARRVARGAGANLEQAFFRPRTLSGQATTAIALLPPALAGLLLFRLPVLVMILVAIGIGLAAQLVARRLGWPLDESPVLPALIGVGLCGPLSWLAWPAVVAALAAVLSVLRWRYAPLLRIHVGVLAYAVVFLSSGGAMAAYVRPGSSMLFPEPITQWSRFFGGSAHFLEPMTLYVGNLAGPALCTSLLAVGIALVWLWYAGRLSLPAALAFGLAGGAVAVGQHWDPVFQLDSGPAWFVLGFTLCDRRLLPDDQLLRPVLGACAGVLGIGLRAVHGSIEDLFLVVAAIQVVFSLLETAVRLADPRVRRVSVLGTTSRRGPLSA